MCYFDFEGKEAQKREKELEVRILGNMNEKRSERLRETKKEVLGKSHFVEAFENWVTSCIDVLEVNFFSKLTAI